MWWVLRRRQRQLRPMAVQRQPPLLVRLKTTVGLVYIATRLSGNYGRTSRMCIVQRPPRVRCVARFSAPNIRCLVISTEVVQTGQET
jgi:hypothetical protein